VLGLAFQRNRRQRQQEEEPAVEQLKQSMSLLDASSQRSSFNDHIKATWSSYARNSLHTHTLIFIQFYVCQLLLQYLLSK